MLFLMTKTTKTGATMVLNTQREVQDAVIAAAKTRSRSRREALLAAIEDAKFRATEPCCGEAHSNPHVDNCTQCAPFWGHRMPTK